jgi:hypothetical protein
MKRPTWIVLILFTLIIYSIVAEENWDPIIRIFNSHYPQIKVTTFDLSEADVLAAVWSRQ